MRKKTIILCSHQRINKTSRDIIVLNVLAMGVGKENAKWGRSIFVKNRTLFAEDTSYVFLGNFFSRLNGNNPVKCSPCTERDKQDHYEK